MRRPILLALGLLASFWAQEALGCIPPPPPLQLSGESDEDYAARARAFHAAQLDEDRRRQQAAWFDAATVVSLGRITSAEVTPIILSNGLSRARRVEAARLGQFKGELPVGGRVVMQDVVATTCGIFGGGTATRGDPGDYIVTFEKVQPEGTGNVGLLLRDLREPRLIANIDRLVQDARKAAASTGVP